MADSSPKKHHWVPQCYLRNFATAENSEQVFMYRNGLDPIVVGIANIAAENDLYTFTNKNTGEKTKEVEKMFSMLEGAASPALKKVATQKNLDLTDSERGALVQFTAFLVTRGPSFSDWLKNMTAEAHKLRMKAMAEHPEHMREKFTEAGIAFDNEEEFQKTREAILDFDNHMKIEMSGGEGGLFKEAAEIAMDLTELFATEKSWHLLVSDGDRVFVTSDNPVIVQTAKGVPRHMADGYGFGTVFLTISPEVCFVMRSEPLDREIIKVGPKWVDYINRSIMKTTHRQVYANLKSRDIKRAYDGFQAGVESQVNSARIGNTPYVVTSGIERDAELPVLERYSTAVPQVALG